jgi:hypothetical protein
MLPREITQTRAQRLVAIATRRTATLCGAVLAVIRHARRSDTPSRSRNILTASRLRDGVSMHTITCRL